jgi:prephenate dehydrogenase
METIAIVGLGLIGGSFGLAMREAGFPGRILGVSEPEYVRVALDLGAITESATLAQAAAQADLIYLSQTVERIRTTIEHLSSFTPLKCLVTDVGSTKRSIVQHAAKYLSESKFLGGHPMAGKETRGIQAAEATLFRDRPYVLTSVTNTPLESEFRVWLERLGARVVYLTPEQHDRAVAFTSHLPQLLSTALAETLSREQNPDFLDVFGPGLIDMTRLALSSPDLWDSILKTNADEVACALQAFSRTLTSLETSSNQDNSSVHAAFAEAASFAKQLRDSKPQR